MSMLLAYNAAGEVVATLDYMVIRDDAGNVTGLVDFDAHEAAGGELTDVWIVQGATGSKTWPEHLGGSAHAFRVELDGPPGRKRISTLVHKVSGHRRHRMDVQGVGRPDRPLLLDEAGRLRA